MSTFSAAIWTLVIKYPGVVWTESVVAGEIEEKRVCEYPGCGTVLSSYNRGSFCSLHESLASAEYKDDISSLSVQEKESLEEILAVADELLRTIEKPRTKKVYDQNLVDSMFYFKIYNESWIECVRSMRRDLFGWEEPPTGFQTEGVQNPIENLYKRLSSVIWFEKQFTERGKAIPTGFLSLSIDEEIERLKGRKDELTLYLKLEALGKPFAISPQKVWYHIAYGLPAIFGFVESHTKIGTPSYTQITIYDPDAINPASLGWIGKHLKAQPSIWDLERPHRRRRKNEAQFTTEVLIRTWTILCLEEKLQITARRAMKLWNDHIADSSLRLSIGGITETGEVAYARNKKKLKEHMGDLMDVNYIEGWLPLRGLDNRDTT